MEPISSRFLAWAADSELSVAQALREAQLLGVERLDAQWLLESVLQCSHSWLVAHADTVLSAEQRHSYQHLLTRRLAGEPVAYLLGEQEFFGLALAVSPAVLIPRPDTETLATWALELVHSQNVKHLVDLGTGSGAIALAIKSQSAQLLDLQVCASDLSTAALAIALQNATRCQLAIEWRQGSWWQPWQGERFDLAVSNPPYIAEQDPHLSALCYEPQLALTSGIDGLDAIRHIIQQADAYLQPGAWLLLEHGYDQHAAVAALLADKGFQQISYRVDLGGHIRCTGGVWTIPQR